MCGHGRGNRAPCAGWAICASFAPLAVYIYGFGGESCTTRLALLRSARLGPTKLRFCAKTLFLWAFRSSFGLAPQNAMRFSAVIGPDRDRAWHPRELGQGNACSSLASGKSSTPPARCIHHSRHDASSAGYRLLASFAPGVASREPESRRSPAHAPRKRRLAPTFRCGAFFFVASALADLSSARLTLSSTDSPRAIRR